MSRKQSLAPPLREGYCPSQWFNALALKCHCNDTKDLTITRQMNNPQINKEGHPIYTISHLPLRANSSRKAQFRKTPSRRRAEVTK
ncbi:Uncharacterised protein [Chlamydia trachomatis]|nr:Uncharacterised protein [Chlamydia trachomatis]